MERLLTRHGTEVLLHDIVDFVCGLTNRICTASHAFAAHDGRPLHSR